MKRRFLSRQRTGLRAPKKRWRHEMKHRRMEQSVCGSFQQRQPKPATRLRQSKERAHHGQSSYESEEPS